MISLSTFIGVVNAVAATNVVLLRIVCSVVKLFYVQYCTLEVLKIALFLSWKTLKYGVLLWKMMSV